MKSEFLNKLKISKWYMNIHKYKNLYTEILFVQDIQWIILNNEKIMRTMMWLLLIHIRKARSKFHQWFTPNSSSSHLLACWTLQIHNMVVNKYGCVCMCNYLFYIHFLFNFYQIYNLFSELLPVHAQAMLLQEL